MQFSHCLASPSVMEKIHFFKSDPWENKKILLCISTLENVAMIFASYCNHSMPFFTSDNDPFPEECVEYDNDE